MELADFETINPFGNVRQSIHNTQPSKKPFERCEVQVNRGWLARVLSTLQIIQEVQDSLAVNGRILQGFQIVRENADGSPIGGFGGGCFS